MAKRKRLTPVDIKAPEPAMQRAPETKSMGFPMGDDPASTRRPPIAQVAGDAAAQAALEEVAGELHAARAEGRMVLSVPLSAVQADHLVRDRIVQNDDDMAALKASIAARGQQAPIEVVDLGQGRYGLISGWRRLQALRELQQETGAAQYGNIQCLIRQIETDPDAYIAMVEENEIRANLSFYERARLAAQAACLGLYPDAGAAVQALFERASAAKKSKIGSFITVYQALDAVLQFPAAIPERLGLALAGALDKDAEFAARLKDSLRKSPATTAEAERTRLERALRKSPTTKPDPQPEIIPGVVLQAAKGRVVLSGKGVTPALQSDLTAWLRGLGS